MLQTGWWYAAVVVACLTAASGLFAFRRMLHASKMAFGLVFTAILVAFAGVLVFALQSHAAAERQEMRQNYEILRVVNRLASMVAHAESGQRGYILTLKPKYLAQFTFANDRIVAETDAFTKVLEGDAEAREAARRLTDTIAAKFTEMRSTLEALSKRSREDSLAIVQTDKGLELAAAIDTICDELRTHAKARVFALSQSIDRFETRIGLGTGALLILAVATIVAASLLSARDHAKRAETQRELESRNDMLALAGEIANIGHWRVSAPASEIWWSDQVFRIHGMDPRCGMPTREQAMSHFSPEDIPRINAKIDGAIAAGESFQFEAQLTRGDGSVADVISRGTCSKDASGKVSSLFGILIDVTQIRRSERSLASSERLYRLLAENITDVLVRFDAHNVLTFVSPSSNSLLGCEPAEMLGASFLDFVHPDDREMVTSRLTRLQLARDERDISIDYRLQHRSGEWVWIEANARTLVDDDGSADGWIAILRDFRQRKEVEDRLAAAIETADVARRQAESANQAKSDFLAAMSHEIRTPLNSIVGFTGLMLDNRALDGDLRDQAEIVRSSGSALLTVINDILDFSKIEAGKIEIEQFPFAPNALFANALAIVRGMAISKCLDITANIDPALPDGLMGDQGRIQQVLLNLLNNAVKFTAQGSVVLNVRVEKDDAKSVRLRLSVVDTGVGIEKSKHDRLFQRFSQADASVSREYGGSGLGLAICKRLVELMGGEIGVFSDEGRGSNFWFTLTLARAKVMLGTGPAPTCVAAATGRLLLVEDIEVNQLLARTLLEADGHVVDVVASGEAAIVAVQERRYDAVLMDVQMPGMGGVAATKAIRSMSSCADLPIIAMTANVLAEQVREFREAGMNDHVGKPINRGELRAALARWLDAPKSAAIDAATAFDAEAFESIASMLGARKTSDTLGKFLTELDTRLLMDDLGPATREAFQRDAHVVTSIAGMLGFSDLAQRCAAIVMATLEDGRDFELKGIEVLRAKSQAVIRVRALMSHEQQTEAAA